MVWVQGETRLTRVLVDIDTQWDFLDPGGMLPARNREALVPQLRRLMGVIRLARYPVISCVETHRPSDSVFGLPLYCVLGTTGHTKLPFTLLSPRIVVHADNSFDLPYNVMSRYRQVIFLKQDDDIFGNPKADRLLTELEPQEYVIFGVGLERWIKGVALGLLARHKKVAVIGDACGFWAEADADLSMRQLRAKGIRILTVDELAKAATAPRRRGTQTARVSARHHPAGPAERRRSDVQSASGSP